MKRKVLAFLDKAEKNLSENMGPYPQLRYMVLVIMITVANLTGLFLIR